MNSIQPEIRDFGLAGPSPSLIQGVGRIDLRPGEWGSLTRVVFKYKGPRQDIVVGWGYQTKGRRFDDGRSLSLYHYQLIGPFRLNLALDFVDLDLSALVAGRVLPAPTPGLYPTLGVGLQEFDYGDLDTWAWVTNQTALDNVGLSGILDYTREPYRLALRSDGAFRLVQG